VSAYSDLILADAPFLYWRLDDPSGTTAEDATANNRDGTYANTPTLAAPGLIADDADTAVTLNQAQLEYVSRAFAGVSGGNVFSMECWIKGGIQPNDGAVVMMESRSDVGSSEITKIGGSDAGADGLFVFIRNNGGTAVVNNVFVTGGNLYNNQPHHIVLTVENAITWTWRLYVDAVERGSGTYTRGSYTAHNSVSIGARLSGGTIGDYFHGTMDEFALYDYRLSSARVLAHYVGRDSYTPGAPPWPYGSGGAKSDIVSPTSRTRQTQPS
jgi:hypothetical protein